MMRSLHHFTLWCKSQFCCLRLCKVMRLLSPGVLDFPRSPAVSYGVFCNVLLTSDAVPVFSFFLPLSLFLCLQESILALLVWIIASAYFLINELNNTFTIYIHFLHIPTCLSTLLFLLVVKLVYLHLKHSIQKDVQRSSDILYLRKAHS